MRSAFTLIEVAVFLIIVLIISAFGFLIVDWQFGTDRIIPATVVSKSYVPGGNSFDSDGDHHYTSPKWIVVIEFDGGADDIEMSKDKWARYYIGQRVDAIERVGGITKSVCSRRLQ